MDFGLTDKIALVTGGSRGIGKACVLALANEGVNVTFSYASNEAAANQTVAEVEAAGGKAQAVKFDVADSNAGKNAIDALVKEKGALHILVNNAGVAINGLLMRYKDEDLDRLFRTNVYGAFYLARAAARPMMKAKWGRIVMMGSVVGQMGNTGQAAYCATKASLDGMTKALARELASRNITANVVAPGFIDTDMTKEHMSDEMREGLLSQIPSGKMGTPEDVAQAVTYLCSKPAGYISGHVLNVNGGLYM